MRPPSHCAIGVSALTVVLLWGHALLAEPRADTPCQLKPGPTRTVVRVLDAETVKLDDGQEVRLIGALAPRSPDMNPDAGLWMPQENALTTLRTLVLGHAVELAHAGRRRDRYGRMLAHLFLDNGTSRVWVQGELLRKGHARAYGLPGNFACMPELLAHERVARDARAGLWANATYAARDAKRARSLLRSRNTYQIVVGDVTRIKVTSNRTYLDFGDDWRKDFSVEVANKVLRANPSWAKSLETLKGRRVEVRGWIDYSFGPFIEIEDPSQIHAVGGRLPGRTPPSGGATTSSEHDRVPREKKKRPAEKPPGALDL